MTETKKSSERHARGPKTDRLKLVVALGGNALLRRGEVPTADTQRRRAAEAMAAIADLAQVHDVVVTHGNGPQVGLLALQAAAYEDVPPYPLDVLGAETEGMIGYVLEQELENRLPGRAIATVLTQVVVDGDDPAFRRPTKPIGPIYTRAEAERLAAERGWVVAADGSHFRRVVPSPDPQRIVELAAIRKLVESGTVVVCTGGGGIPVVEDSRGLLHGVEAVIDKDLASALLAEQLGAHALVIVTDVDAVYRDWGTPDQAAIRRASPQALAQTEFAEGSMGPKVRAACQFVERTGGIAAIGSIADTPALVRGDAGTTVTRETTGLELENVA